MSNLQVTYGNFVAKGIVTGLSKENAFTKGQKDGGNPWQKIQFGVKTSKTEFVYVELLGSKTKDVQFVYRDVDTKKKDYNKTEKVLWTDRYKEREDNFEISNSVKAGLERDEEGKKLKDNKVLVPYDAIEYMKKFLKDGESVYVRGQLEISSYNGKVKETYKIQQIYILNEAVDFDSPNFIKEASFTQEIVFTGYSDDYETGKTLIDTYIIYKKDGVFEHTPYTFVINPKKYEKESEKCAALKKLVSSFKNLSFGSTIRVNGNINNGVVLTQVPAQVDDFGGFDAEGQGESIETIIKELEITKGDGTFLKRDRYTEDDFFVGENPFVQDETDDISDDDLPF